MLGTVFVFVLSGRFELPFQAPEACVLSVELQEQNCASLSPDASVGTPTSLFYLL